MDTQTWWKRIFRSILGGLICSLLLAVHASAAPLDIPKGRIDSNDSEGPEVLSAVYVPDGTTVIYLPQATAVKEGETSLLMCATVEIEVVYPGAKRAETKKVFSVMYIRKEHLEKFPTPLELVTHDSNLNYFRIDTVDQAKGLEKLQWMHKMALKQQVSEKEAVGEDDE
jgi:hypothetical protein